MNQPTSNTSPATASTCISPPWKIERVSASVDSVLFHIEFAKPIELTRPFLADFDLAAERAPNDSEWHPKFEMHGHLATGVLVRYSKLKCVFDLLNMVGLLEESGRGIFSDIRVASVNGRITLQLQEDHSFADAKLLARQMAMMTPGTYDTPHPPPSPWIGGMGSHQGVSWQTYAVRKRSGGAEAVTFAFQAEVKDVLSGQGWRPEDLHTLDFRHLLYPVRLVALASSVPVEQLQPTRSFGDRVVTVLSLVRWPSRLGRRNSAPQYGEASSRKELMSKYLNKRLYDAVDRLTARVHRC